VNSRLTRSSGHGAAVFATVVRTTLPRMTPRNPRRRMRRSTVQRATTMPSRFNCFHRLCRRHRLADWPTRGPRYEGSRCHHTGHGHSVAPGCAAAHRWHTIALPGIRLMPTYPAMHGLSGAANLRGNRLNRCPLGGMFVAPFKYQATARSGISGENFTTSSSDSQELEHPRKPEQFMLPSMII
jgi:hypothetical protein